MFTAQGTVWANSRSRLLYNWGREGEGRGGEGRGGRGEGVKGGGMKMLETEIFLVLWPIFFCKMGVGEQSPTLVLSQYA